MLHLLLVIRTKILTVYLDIVFIHLDCRYRVAPLVSVLVEKRLAISTSFFMASVLHLTTPYLPCIGGRGGIKMASASTPSANEPAKDIILVHTGHLKPIIKVHFSGRMIYSGISDVAIASVNSEKTRLKKLMKMIIIIITEKVFTSK